MQIVIGGFPRLASQHGRPGSGNLVGDYTIGGWASGKVFTRRRWQRNGCLRRAVKVNGEWRLRVKLARQLPLWTTKAPAIKPATSQCLASANHTQFQRPANVHLGKQGDACL